MSEIKKGNYRHYKGNVYELVSVARNSETLEEMVVYKALYKSKEFGENAWWVRSKKMFFEEVIFQGKKQKRFQYIGEED